MWRNKSTWIIFFCFWNDKRRLIRKFVILCLGILSVKKSCAIFHENLQLDNISKFYYIFSTNTTRGKNFYINFTAEYFVSELNSGLLFKNTCLNNQIQREHRTHRIESRIILVNIQNTRKYILITIKIVQPIVKISILFWVCMFNKQNYNFVMYWIRKN